MSLGGILGSFVRWQITEVSGSLPIAVFIVNQLGVFVAGIFAFRINRDESARIFWISGFAGGFTTMSSLAYLLSESSAFAGLKYALATFLTSIVILQLLKGRVRK